MHVYHADLQVSSCPENDMRIGGWLKCQIPRSPPPGPAPLAPLLYPTLEAQSLPNLSCLDSRSFLAPPLWWSVIKPNGFG